MALCMDYHSRGNLANLVLDERINLSVGLQLRMAHDVAAGIAFIHTLEENNEKAVHGNLKLENILLTEDLRCKISDFGYLKAVTMTPSMRATFNGRSGTLQANQIYQPPENLGNPTLDFTQAGDVYSLSIMLYTLLSRKLPNPDQYIAHVRNGTCPAIDVLYNARSRYDCRERQTFKEIIEQMKLGCAQDPALRPSSSRIRNKFDELLTLENEAEIGQHAKEVSSQLHDQVKFAIADQRRVPVQTFSLMTGGFDQGTRKSCCIVLFFMPLLGATLFFI